MKNRYKIGILMLLSLVAVAVLCVSANATVVVDDAKDIIWVSGGKETLDTIYANASVDDTKLWNVTGTTWVLNYSIQVNQSAILDLSKATNCDELRLNNDSAINVNITILGKLFVNDTLIRAWDVSEGAVADEFNVYTPFPKPYILIIPVDEVADATAGYFSNVTVEWLGWEETNQYGVTWVDVGTTDPLGSVDNCTFLNDTTGVFLDGVARFEIKDSVFNDTHYADIYITGTSSYIWVNDTTFTGDNAPVSCSAIQTGANDDYIYVNDCNITDVSTGLDISGDLGGFTNVDMWNCDYEGIGLDGNNNTFTTCIIGGSSAGWGVYMNSDGIDNVFEDCTIESSSNCFYLNYQSEVVVNNGSLICTGDHTIEAVDNCTIALYNVSDLYNTATNSYSFHIETACSLTYQGYWLPNVLATAMNITAQDTAWWSANIYEIPSIAYVGGTFRDVNVLPFYIEPNTGFANTTINTYGSATRRWTVTGNGSTTLSQRIGGLVNGVEYYRYVDGVHVSSVTPTTNWANFHYSGGWSDHTFLLTTTSPQQTTTNYLINTVVPIMVAVVLIIVGLALLIENPSKESLLALMIITIIAVTILNLIGAL